jgi:glycosyltransferase involved in cell wall biosynthesis
MRILHVIHGWFPRHAGGTESYVARLADELRQRGHEVAILAGSDIDRPAPTWEREEWHGFPLYVVRRAGLYLESWYRSYSPEVELMVAEILADWRPDVVHVHHWRRLTRNLIEVAALAGIPAVATLHDTSTTCPKLFRQRDGSFCPRGPSGDNCHDCAERFAFQSDDEIRAQADAYRDDFRAELSAARRLIAPSVALRDVIAEHYPAVRDRIVVVPHGSIAEGPPRRRVEREGGPRRGPIRMAYWGALQPMKGVHLVLEALAALRERELFTLDLWGSFAGADEDYEHEMRARAADLGVNLRGPFTPQDLTDRGYDVAVFPSIALESWSFTVDEAFARGIPVIVSDRGAPAERMGGGGLTFRAESASDLKRALLRILRDPGLLARCRQAIPAPISFWEHAGVLEGFYRQAAAAGPDPAAFDPARTAARAARIAAQLERRDREVYLLRGKVEQESVRAAHAEAEIKTRDAVVEKKEAVLADFNRSLLDLAATVRQRDAELAGARATLSEQTRLVGIRDRDLELFARSNSELRELLAQRDELLRVRETSIDEHARELDRLREVERALDVSRREAEERALELAAAVGARDELAARTAELDVALAAVREEVVEAARIGGELRLALETASRRSTELAAELAASAHSVTEERSARQAVQSLLEATTRMLRAAIGARARAAEADALEEALARSERLRENLVRLASERDAEVRAEAAARRAQAEALELAVAEARSLSAQAGESRRILAEIERRLRPIGEESAGASLAHASPDHVFEHVVANHERLHRLLRERDELLHALAQKVVHAPNGAHAELPAGPTAADTESLIERLRARPRARPAPRRGERLRILFVIHDFLPKHAAGTEIYAFNLAKRLAERHDVHFLFCEARHDLPRYTVSRGNYQGLDYTEVVHNYKWESLEEKYRDPRMDAIFGQVVESFSPDVVHIQHLHYFSMDCIRIAKAYGAPVIYTLHEFMLMCARGGQLLREDMEICEQPVPERCADCVSRERLAGDYGQGEGRRVLDKASRFVPAPLREAFTRFAGAAVPHRLDDRWRAVYAAAARARLDYIAERLRGVDLFISPSEFLRRKFIESGMVRADQIVHSDNGFDVQPFAAVERTPSADLRFGFVGTIAEYKGVHVLVEAFNEITEPDVSLEIWGDVEVFQEYKARILPAIKNPRIHLRGTFDNKDVARVLAGIDVLVVPSLWFENSPLTIHEAWLAGVPVICSNIGGMAELVKDRIGGLHFAVGDAADLRAKMREIIADRSLVEKFRAHPGEVKPIDANAREIEGYYYDALAQAPAR